MFHPLSCYIGLRYTRAKRRNHFISFISLASALGIALGVAVLITVLSVMNGFDFEIRNHFFNLANQVTISGADGRVEDWQSLQKNILREQGVVAAAPFVSGQGMLNNGSQVAPVAVTGIIPEQQAKVSTLDQSMLQGNLQALKPGSFGIVLGATLAQNLGVGVGDKIILFTPQPNVSPIGVLPTYKRLTVVGVFYVEGNELMNAGMALMNLQDAQKLYSLGQAVSGLRLRVQDLYDAPRIAAQIAARLPNTYTISDWTQEYGDFFKAIRMEKTMMFLILLLIIAVAAFNLVSTLVMLVTDKRAEIAILRTLGATPGTIMRIFIVQGCVIGVFGTLLGLILGLLLALNATAIVNWLEQVLHTQFISSSVYFINYLPSRLQWSDVFHVCSVALILSLLATLYPAWSAARTQPAEALRYE